MSARATHRIVIGEAEAGQRLDRCLAAGIEGLSRVRIQDLIRQGCVSCGGRTLGEASGRVKLGAVIDVTVPAAEWAEPAAEEIRLTVVYEDEQLIVIDKPAGLVVHPAPGHATGTLVNALLAHCRDSLSGIGGVRRPGIVHRLDKDTSGLLVVAKTDRAHHGLALQFASHGADGRLERRYRAFAWGEFGRRTGTIDAALGRSPTNRVKVAVVRDGRRAVTHWEVSARFGAEAAARSPRALISELQLALETGRTHQIRVHLAHSGHPIVGDPVYGTGFRASARQLGPRAQALLAGLNRQALHAAVLGFEHPVTGRPLRFESALPPDMQGFREALVDEHGAAS
ncbi:MAG: RluA family pseudouridine synthase [Hyphomicrobiaceae bacterium]